MKRGVKDDCDNEIDNGEISVNAACVCVYVCVFV